MKRFLATALCFLIILTFSACRSNIGEVSLASDPLSYFASDRTWRINEIEDRFGTLDVPNEQIYGMFGYTEYYGYLISAFGESWDLQIYEVEGSVPYVASGCFYFDQNDYSDKELAKYRDEIIKYYTESFGNPDRSYGTEELPAWRWNTSTMTITLQDCSALLGELHLLFSE